MAPIVKSLQEDQRLATFVVLIPEEYDLHGHIYSAEEVQAACYDFNTKSGRANLLHKAETDAFTFQESYVLPCDIELDGKPIKKGTWVATIKATPEIWPFIKSGELNGLSIGCTGILTDVEE